MKIHTLYDRPPKVKTQITEKTLTHQSFKDECDINKIIERYHATGFMGDPHRPVDQSRQPIYGDFTNVPDLKGAYDQIIQAEGLFASLPATIRKQFENDPVRFLDFCSNPDNRPWLAEHGFIRDFIGEIEPENPKKEPIGEKNGEKAESLD